jgi:DNA-binding MarR family transcriptional regulator
LEQLLLKQDSVARLIGLARRRLRQVVGRRVARFELSPQQFWALVFLGSVEGPALSGLCERMGMDAPTASRIVSALVRRGLVSAREVPDDRRLTRLHLTARGKTLARELQPLADEFRGVVERDLGRAEGEELRRLLKKVIGSLDRYQARGGNS